MSNFCLNESPSEKEGKLAKGNPPSYPASGLNESPSEKEGKCYLLLQPSLQTVCLNESPSEKEGKSRSKWDANAGNFASMKVPPKRKGNVEDGLGFYFGECLNESPSEKEGK